MGMSHTGKQRGAYCGRSCSLAQRRAPAAPPRKLLVGIAAPIAAGLPAVAAAQQRRPPARPCLSKQCCALTLPGCLQLAAGGATPAVTEWPECALRSAAVLPEATLRLQEADSQGLEQCVSTKPLRCRAVLMRACLLILGFVFTLYKATCTEAIARSRMISTPVPHRRA